MKYYIDEQDKVYGYAKKGAREMTAEEFELFKNPPKSNDELFAEEMNAINNRYKSDTKLAIEKVSSAIGWDGATESTKVANARAELYQLKENYDTQSLAIINKYYGP